MKVKELKEDLKSFDNEKDVFVAVFYSGACSLKDDIYISDNGGHVQINVDLDLGKMLPLKRVAKYLNIPLKDLKRNLEERRKCG